VLQPERAKQMEGLGGVRRANQLLMRRVRATHAALACQACGRLGQGLGRHTTEGRGESQGQRAAKVRG
jgi:hypothetical protein